MENTMHTPGPWKISSCSDGREIVSHTCGITFPIADVADGLGKANGSQEAKANARLIASAPDLLAICKEMFKIIPVADPSWIEVIKKAEGHI